MRYQTKLLIAAGVLLAMSLSAAALAYWGVTQSHSYFTRSRIAHQQLARQLQLSRHSQQLFKAWTDTLMKRPSTHSFPEAEFEALYRLNVKRRQKWLSQFIADQAVAAE